MRLGIDSSLAGHRGRPALALAMLTAAALLAALALAGPARASSIFFIREANIWVANPDGSGAKQVTTDGVTDPYDFVSSAKLGAAPLLAFHRASPSEYGTIAPDGSGYTVNPYNAEMASGTPFTRLDDAGDRVTWSQHDISKKFAQSVGVDGSAPAIIYDIYLMEAIQVTFGNTAGSSLLFTDVGYSYEVNGQEPCEGKVALTTILVRQVPGPASPEGPAGPVEALYCEPDAFLDDPALRPDGQLIAAVVESDVAGSTGRIATIPIGGGVSSGSQSSPLTYLTPVGMEATVPDFSPDGTEIAFQGPGSTIYTIPAGGGVPTQILTNATVPAWSPYSLPAVGPSPSPMPKPGPHGQAGALAAAKLTARSVRRGRPVILRVTLRAAAKIKVRVLRRAAPHGRSHKPRYVAIGKLTFRGKAGPNTLRVTKVHGRRLAPGRYEVLVSAGGKARTLAFTVRR